MLLEKLLTVADTHPGKLAVADPVRELDYAKLTTFARIMRDLIVKHAKSERVGLLLPGSTAFVGALFGCMWAGRIAVPLNFLLQARELRRIVKDAGIDAIFTIRHFQELADDLGVKYVLLEEMPFKRRFLLSKLSRRPAPPAVTEEQTAVILYTSGTSGDPKGVELTYGNLSSNCRDSISHARIETDHVLLSVLPPFHVFGLTAMTLLPMWCGMTVHYIPRFSPVKTVKAISEKNISVFMAIPSMYTAMSRVKHASAESYKSLHMSFSGGEPLMSTTARTFYEKFDLHILQGYGLTETAPVVSLDVPWDNRPGSVGRPIPNCRVRIVGSDGAALGANVDGEIQINGPCVMKGYYRRPEDTSAVIDPDGWFKTGDQGRLDDDGFLHITGRVKDMLIIGGENVFPSEIEAVLLNHEAVEEAAVIGVPDPSRGEVAAAYVVLKSGTTADENDLRGFCRDQLASLKVPREIHIATDFPRGPTGKILKRALRDRYDKTDA